MPTPRQRSVIIIVIGKNNGKHTDAGDDASHNQFRCLFSSVLPISLARLYSYPVRCSLNDGSDAQSNHGDPKCLSPSQSAAKEKVKETPSQASQVVTRDYGNSVSCHDEARGRVNRLAK